VVSLPDNLIGASDGRLDPILLVLPGWGIWLGTPVAEASRGRGRSAGGSAVPASVLTTEVGSEPGSSGYPRAPECS
jgi:hypothetical protein